MTDDKRSRPMPESTERRESGWRERRWVKESSTIWWVINTQFHSSTIRGLPVLTKQRAQVRFLRPESSAKSTCISVEGPQRPPPLAWSACQKFDSAPQGNNFWSLMLRKHEKSSELVEVLRFAEILLINEPMKCYLLKRVHGIGQIFRREKLKNWIYPRLSQISRVSSSGGKSSSSLPLK